MNLIEIGAIIKQQRKLANLTQRELSKESDVGLATIEKLENQRLSEIGYKKLLRILNTLALDLRITTFNQSKPTLEDLQNEDEAKDDTRLGR